MQYSYTMYTELSYLKLALLYLVHKFQGYV